ncbi:MAG: S-layer protein [Candidatus Heimdallarchaeota archaeon]|nr:S-layer protein [Candidatus Heimdallarchaeota archaeon]
MERRNLKKLLNETKNGFTAKNIRMFSDPEKMKPILSNIRWEILQRLSKKPTFPADLAREMGIHEQKVYYHIRQLIKSNLVKVAYEKEIRGAKARYYTTTEKAYGIELDPDEKGLKFQSDIAIDEKLLRFFKEFSRDSKFDGLIVVGSPEAHGPHKTWARDGHYAIYLGMFIGQFLPPKDDLYVKLDVEVRAEKTLDQNLILIGGPAVNLVTKDINSKLKQIAFDNHIKGIAPDARFGRGITSSQSDIFYSQNNAGIIFKEPNPYNPDKTVIAFAGQGRRGTKAAILAITHKWNEILKDYTDGSFRKVVEGYDLDGNGTIDSVEILE